MKPTGAKMKIAHVRDEVSVKGKEHQRLKVNTDIGYSEYMCCVCERYFCMDSSYVGPARCPYSCDEE